jgi:hypothetical protein
MSPEMLVKVAVFLALARQVKVMLDFREIRIGRWSPIAGNRSLTQAAKALKGSQEPMKPHSSNNTAMIVSSKIHRTAQYF